MSLLSHYTVTAPTATQYSHPGLSEPSFQGVAPDHMCLACDILSVLHVKVASCTVSAPLGHPILDLCCLRMLPDREV